MSDSVAAAALRMFYAFWPSAETRQQFTQAARALACGEASRAVPADNYHLTLAFVGEVSAPRFADLRQIGRDLCARSCLLRFDAYEYWPKPEVAVASARDIPEPLQALWASLHARLADSGFVLQPKRLRPHVTLARKVAQAPVPTTMLPIEWTPREFHLVQSTTGTGHSVYTVVDTWPLLYAQ